MFSGGAGGEGGLLGGAEGGGVEVWVMWVGVLCGVVRCAVVVCVAGGFGCCVVWVGVEGWVVLGWRNGGGGCVLVGPHLAERRLGSKRWFSWSLFGAFFRHRFYLHLLLPFLFWGRFSFPN